MEGGVSSCQRQLRDPSVPPPGGPLLSFLVGSLPPQTPAVELSFQHQVVPSSKPGSRGALDHRPICSGHRHHQGWHRGAGDLGSRGQRPGHWGHRVFVGRWGPLEPGVWLGSWPPHAWGRSRSWRPACNKPEPGGGQGRGAWGALLVLGQSKENHGISRAGQQGSSSLGITPPG